jgi:hypothetical protein
MSNGAEYCRECGQFFVRFHDCPIMQTVNTTVGSNDIQVIDAAIDTLQFQIHNLRNYKSREQIRCWNIQLRNLQTQRKKLQGTGPAR